MELTQAVEIVKAKLPDKRFRHVLGVIDTARDLAIRFGADVSKAMLAAALHDIAKYEASEQMKRYLTENNETPELLQFHTELWHAPVGALIVQQEYGIDDEEVLSAIRFHTTGRAKMSLLEKIIFLADYIEPGRTTPRVDECRKLAESNLDGAIIFAYQRTIEYLVSKCAKIHPETIYGYNDLIGASTN